MANNNQISISIPDADLQAVLDAIDTIRTKLPFLISLMPAERHEMLKMGDGTVAFVKKAYEYALADGAALPGFINIVEFGKDVIAVDDLLKVLRPLEKLSESLEDTVMLAGSEAYMAALAYYNLQKAAMKAGQNGAKTVVQNLAERFPGGSARKRVADDPAK